MFEYALGFNRRITIELLRMWHRCMLSFPFNDILSKQRWLALLSPLILDWESWDWHHWKAPVVESCCMSYSIYTSIRSDVSNPLSNLQKSRTYNKIRHCTVGRRLYILVGKRNHMKGVWFVLILDGACVPDWLFCCQSLDESFAVFQSRWFAAFKTCFRHMLSIDVGFLFLTFRWYCRCLRPNFSRSHMLVILRPYIIAWEINL